MDLFFKQMINKSPSSEGEETAVEKEVKEAVVSGEDENVAEVRYNYLKHLANIHLLPSQESILSKHPDINQKMQLILFDWIVEIISKFKMSIEYLCGASYVYYSYLAMTTKSITRRQLQLIGVASVDLVCKSMGDHNGRVEISDWTYISDNCFAKYEFTKIQIDILNTLKFGLMLPSVYRFLNNMREEFGMTNQEDIEFTNYLATLSIVNGIFPRYPAYVVAECCFLMKTGKGYQVEDSSQHDKCCEEIKQYYLEMFGTTKYKAPVVRYNSIRKKLNRSPLTLEELPVFEKYNRHRSPRPFVLSRIPIDSIDYSEYKKDIKMGEGSFGQVYKICPKILQTQVKYYACKSARNDDNGLNDEAIAEISMLSEMNHENIIKIVAPTAVVDKIKFCMDVYEPFEEVIKNGLPLIQVKKYAYQLLKGFKYMHAMDVIHRDIKPANILIDKASDTLKISDLGLAIWVPSDRFEVKGTNVCSLWYKPPEIVFTYGPYNKPLDIWGVGCILVEMATGKALFDADCEDDLANMMAEKTDEKVKLRDDIARENFLKRHKSFSVDKIKSVLWKNKDDPDFEKFIDLVHKLLTLHPKERPTAKMALEHPFFFS